MFKKVFASAVLVATAVGLAGCATDDSAISLTVYSGRSEALVQPLIDNFSQETGIEVEVRYAGSAELAAQLLEEGQNSPADVFFAQDAGALGAVGKAGLLQAMPQNILELVGSDYSAADGSWVGVSGRVRVLNYNPEKVTELPNSVFDLADPSWKGRIGIAPTNASFQAFVTAMRVLEGDAKTTEWLAAMKTNAVIYEKNSAILEAVEQGQVDAGLINHYYWFARAKEVGSEAMSSKLAQFADGDAGNLVNSAGVGLLSDSSAGKEFVEYLLSKEAQEYFANETSEYPLISGVAVSSELTPLSEVPAPQIDLSDLDSLEETLALIRAAGLI